MFFEGKIEKYLEEIKKINDWNLSVINNLEKENAYLKDEHYKDKELADMHQRLEQMQNNYYRGYPITEDEKNCY